ncbi:LacI family DNA-binding transcriptional regulator [Christensenella tenuis]|uniref:LacI family DNA-binding transcriptional regulator n=1 Tax=Christensenella tenuis TaxID=2763033 RepID=A0ABR7EBP0_9FIRM|nr:LacI family DNA-binding transcriptional regulator [Christensenella tenuis]MBC5647189.1 LacI family DNA-binding transcriptional regulator [Christensenella tenuis]
MAATISDIARKAGVSLATVSRVINKSPAVSDKSKKKVESAIKELNYIPSAYARGLSRNQSNIIGVIVPEISNPFFSEVIDGISSVADRQGLNVLLFNTDENIEKEARAMRILQEYRIRGLIITPVTGNNEYDKKYVEMFENMNLPIVLVDRNIKNSNFDGVYFDDKAALYKITSLLIENGHKDIALLAGNPNHVIAQKRIEGYQDAFEAADIKPYPQNILAGDFTIESAYQLTKHLILTHRIPTAFIGMTNMLSMGCLKALSEFNIAIPEEVAFIGYDRLAMHDILHLNLTLVEKDAVDMGRKAAGLLIDKINGKSTSSNRFILMPELLMRGSEKYPLRNPNERTFTEK